jgi:hypothetical protein
MPLLTSYFSKYSVGISRGIHMSFFKRAKSKKHAPPVAVAEAPRRLEQPLKSGLEERVLTAEGHRRRASVKVKRK